MIDRNLLLRAYRYMCSVKTMAETYEANRSITKYVHSTSRGHGSYTTRHCLQFAAARLGKPYYRDESLLLGMGWSPYELMSQLLTKAGDPFSGGRSYYSHPSSRAEDKPKIIHQSSATGMQVIPTTGVAQGIQYKEKVGGESHSVVVCSLGDASVTEGEVSEALQFAVLKQLPVIYLVQDNEWGISVTAEEGRAMDAYDMPKALKDSTKFGLTVLIFFRVMKQCKRLLAM